jgi:ubiquinone/menaquinone biosynthesis C-methylase UbiE
MDHLSKDEIGKVVRAYEGRIAEHGFDVAALKSGGLGKQFVRHSTHAQIFDLDGRRIVDIGCGIGMFYHFLRNKKINIKDYIGVDIVEAFLEYNRQTYPEAKFLNIDILCDPIESLQPDVVFMSQLFNAQYDNSDNEAIARAAIERFFAIAREGVVIDFMSTYVDYREAQHHYFEPEAMLRFAKGLTRYASLRHDYLPFEFSLVLRKAPSIALPEAPDVHAYD